MNKLCPLLLVVDIEVDGSLTECDLTYTEELSLTKLVLGCLSVLSHFNMRVKSSVDNMHYLSWTGSSLIVLGDLLYDRVT